MKAVSALRLLFVLASLVALGRAGAAHETDAITGCVNSDGHGIRGALVKLYRAAPQRGGRATLLATTVTDKYGRFELDYRATYPNEVTYLIAHGGTWTGDQDWDRDGNAQAGSHESFIELAAIAGAHGAIPSRVIITERTTVAFAYAMAAFAYHENVAGPSPGLQNAAATAGNLANTSTGGLSDVLTDLPNGSATSTLPEFNSLANLLAGCVEATSAGPCRRLIWAASGTGTPAATDTLTAIENVAHLPARNVVPLYNLSAGTAAYWPRLKAAPNAWTIALAYEGNGAEFDAPGNMTTDAQGNLWITNNYVFNADPTQSTCAGRELLELTPTGQDAPGAPFVGGGVSGAGYGVVVDGDDAVWIGNFGFAGEGCRIPPRGKSVSKFTLSGHPLSPAITGFTEGGISGPQGMAFDQKGNLWIANDKPGTDGQYAVTKYPHGDPKAAIRFAHAELGGPFGLAIDRNGYVWVGNEGNSTVVVLAPNGSVARTFGRPGTPTSGLFLRPLGVAIDSRDNVWIANQGHSNVVMIEPSGAIHRYSGGGMQGPWGITVAGDDRIFVASFGLQAKGTGGFLSEFCGASGCGPGHRTGDPLSPSTGFITESLTRLTGVIVDTAGNVWVADNWMKYQLATNPGGHAMTEFIGLGVPSAK